MTGFEMAWRRIVALEGETFRQTRGKSFTYAIAGGSVVPATTNRQLPRSHFARAWERAPLRGPGQLQDLQGPSYLFAILTDPRVAPSAAGPDPGQGPGAGGEPGNAEPDSPAGPLSPAEALRDVDPRHALLVVTCSSAKARGGQPPGPAGHGTSWPRSLSAARARVLATAAAEPGEVMPAWERYTGSFYRHARPALASAAAAGRLIIISGGYGVVHADERIGWYDKQLRLADWPPGLLESAMTGEARQGGAQAVVAFAPTTTQYATLLRRTRWRDAGISAYLVTVTGVRGGAMAEVPRRLGQAFGALWNRQHDSYPPGTAVEDLS